MRVRIFLAAVLLFSQTTRASECPVIEGGSAQLATLSAEARLEFIHAQLLEDGRSVRRWRLIWALGYAAVLTTELALVPATSHDGRRQLYLGAGSAALGLGTALLTPLHASSDGLALDRKLQEPPREDVCTTLAEAERSLLRAAGDEHFERAPLTHIGNVLFNIGLGLVMGLWFHNWKSAAISMSAGIPIGELMIFTSPTGSMGALAQYRAGKLGDPTPSAKMQGLSLVLHF